MTRNRLTRRGFLQGTSALSLSLMLGDHLSAGERLERIRRAETPTLLETPLAALDRPVTPNDLFYDFLGVIAFIAAAALFFALKERNAKQSSSKLVPVRLRNLFKALPGDLLSFFVVTMAFGLCCWFEIFRMFDQRWFGRIHLVGNRDTAIYLQWELAACVVLGIVLVAVSKLASSRKASGA